MLGNRFNKKVGKSVEKYKTLPLETPISTKMQIPVPLLKECFSSMGSESHAKNFATPRCNNINT